MKKSFRLKCIVFIICIGSINIFCGCTSIQGKMTSSSTININKILNESEDKDTVINSTKLSDKSVTLNYDEIKDSLIRFHVIANSDSEEDQNLKIKVKNEVIDYLYPSLNKSQSTDESRKIIQDNMQEVKKIAEKIIRNNNYNYCVKVELSRENFPNKSYGNITLPQGNYEAFRIIIGEGSGKNWWCVMFPPLCFVDESKAEVQYEKTEGKICEKKQCSNETSGLDDQNKEINKNVEDKENKSKDIQIKFKIVELIEDIFK